SKTFEGSDVHRRLLHYLAEKSLAGEADRLKEYTIGIEAFGKPETYDPKQDSIVRLQVGRLRQKLAVYYQTEATGDSVLASVPKGAYKLNFEYQVVAQEEAIPADPRRWIQPLAIALSVMTLWAVVATIFFV